MAYEFNNDDHFDMKSQMMVGKIGETLWTRTQKADRETGAADNK